MAAAVRPVPRHGAPALTYVIVAVGDQEVVEVARETTYEHAEAQFDTECRRGVWAAVVLSSHWDTDKRSALVAHLQANRERQRGR